MTKTAIAFTGGVDSTYLLHKLLLETDDQIIAFRLRVQSGSAKAVALAEAEDIAAPAVVAWLKAKSRDFDYRVMPIPAFRDGEWSSLECARVGGQMVRDGEADRFCLGRNAEASWTVEEIDADPEKKNVFRRQIEIFREFVPGGAPEHPLKIAGLGKAHAHRDLPAGLMALTVKCKQPRIVDGAIVECGACRTGCEMHRDMAARFAEGMTADQVTDYIHKTRRRGAYIGLPLAGRNHETERKNVYDALRKV